MAESGRPQDDADSIKLFTELLISLSHILPSLYRSARHAVSAGVAALLLIEKSLELVPIAIDSSVSTAAVSARLGCNVVARGICGPVAKAERRESGSHCCAFPNETSTAR
jgi:hypothetical protein